MRVNKERSIPNYTILNSGRPISVSLDRLVSDYRISFALGLGFYK